MNYQLNFSCTTLKRKKKTLIYSVLLNWTPNFFWVDHSIARIPRVPTQLASASIITRIKLKSFMAAQIKFDMVKQMYIKTS